MRRGESDREAVSIVQTALAALGVATLRRSLGSDGTMDGDFGSETERAVKRFQRSVPLVNDRGRPDGILGHDSIHALDARAPASAAGATIPLAGGGAVPRAETATTAAVANRLTVPASADLLDAYQGFLGVRGHPCRRGTVEHQCAVRMSVALGRSDCGFNFANWTHGNVHSGRRRCGGVPPHVTGASELAEYLSSEGLPFTQYRKDGPGARTAREIINLVQGRRGIIYFRRCFDRTATARGSHIDYWDGTITMNDRIRYNAGAEAEPGARNSSRFFRNADGDRRMADVWFCETG